MKDSSLRVIVFLALVAIVVGVVGSVIATNPPGLSPTERAKAATFELNTKIVAALYVKEGWQEFWPEFAAATGAVIGRPDHQATEPSDSYVIFHVSGGGTAWFFGQNENYTFALTNAHAVDGEHVVNALRRHPLMEKLGTIERYAVWYCPNFSNLDEYPSCRFAVDVIEADPVLDFAVLRFDFGTRIKTVTTLALGSYEDVPVGAPLLTVGAALGVNDLDGPGKKLDVHVPYLLDDVEWRWTVPYDMNTVGGFSGSPVIDLRTGLVIGLHRGAILDPRGSGRAVALMVPMEYIARILISYDLPVTTPLTFEDR